MLGDMKKKKWIPYYFELYVDGNLNDVDKSNINLKNQNSSRNVAYYLDFVIFFLQGSHVTPNPPKTHNYSPFIQVCASKKKIRYSFAISFAGMEDEEKRKQIISGIPEIKEEDYRNIQNQKSKN